MLNYKIYIKNQQINHHYLSLPINYFQQLYFEQFSPLDIPQLIYHYQRMNHSFTKNANASIINLFEKMDSNISNFHASLSSSPNYRKDTKQQCQCARISKERKIQQQFYLKQEDVVRKASRLLQEEGNSTFAKLLSFMADYLAKIEEEVSKELLCQCKTEKIEDYSNLQHKLSFLREENHKFFKIIEDKTQECDQLRSKIELLQSKCVSKGTQSNVSSNSIKSHTHFASILSNQLTSRMISSNSSRVSQFRHVWPELTLPLGEVGHKRYFQAPPGNRYATNQSRQILQEKSLNHPFQSTFRKTKIFQKH